MYLQIGDKSKREWIRKVYRGMSHRDQGTDGYKSVIKQKVTEVIKDRKALEAVTGDEDN